MTSKEYVETVKRRNPKLFSEDDSLIKIRTSTLLALLENAFEKGKDSGSGDYAFEALFGGLRK